MRIETLKIGDIKPYENNPRINDESVKYVKESIRQFGFKVPLIIDKNNVIVTGHIFINKTPKNTGLSIGLKKIREV